MNKTNEGNRVWGGNHVGHGAGEWGAPTLHRHTTYKRNPLFGGATGGVSLALAREPLPGTFSNIPTLG